MAGRASIVGAAETSVGKVREHNEDAHFVDTEAGIFVVCDGMGGHAAGEVASGIAVDVVRKQWSSEAIRKASEHWLAQGTAEARKQMIHSIQSGVVAAHDAIIAEATKDRGKNGMGTTLVGAIVVGGDIVFAHCGDSRAYLVRGAIAMQLTEDHTLLARLLAAGVDVDTSNEGARFKSMLTNAIGIGQDCKVSTFVVPVADGDRFLLCSDGITEYVVEAEIGEVLSTMPSPARAAQRLVELALQRGGGDNATALVVRVVEAGERARPTELMKREDEAIAACPLWSGLSPQQRLRALRIALPRDHVADEKIPALTLGDRVAWVIVEGEVVQDGCTLGPGALLYPEALLADRPLPTKHGLAVPRTEVRTLALRSDDFREVCDEDPELGELLLAALGNVIGARRPKRNTARVPPQADPAIGRANTLRAVREWVVPAAARPDADAAVDRALAGLPSDRVGAQRAASNRRGREPTLPPAGADEGQVIIVEAEPPPERVAVEPQATSRDSDPEISIATLIEAASEAEPEPVRVPVKAAQADDHEMSVIVDDDAESITQLAKPVAATSRPRATAVDESSQPEITILRSGRAITAKEGPLAAGTIEARDPARAKRPTDTSK